MNGLGRTDKTLALRYFMVQWGKQVVRQRDVKLITVLSARKERNMDYESL